MRDRDKSAAATLWPNLPSTRASVEHTDKRKSLAEPMWPSLAKPPPNPYRDRLLKNLGELNAKLKEKAR